MTPPGLNDPDTLAALLDGLRVEDTQSQNAFWNHVRATLERHADRRLAPALRRRVAGADIANSVCRTFFAHMAEGDYRIEGVQEMWNLLMSIVAKKIAQRARREQAKKRDYRRELTPGTLGEDERAVEVTVPEADVDDAQIRVLVEDEIRSLPLRNRQRAVATGLWAGKSVADLAREFGVTEERIRQIIRTITATLQDEHR